MTQTDLFSNSGSGRADQSARDAITRVLDANFVVKAGAGAGKTHELLGRMVACVRRGVCTVDEMVAITFTRKAAGELKQRFSSALGDAMVGAEGAELERLALAIRRADECFIGTIHSFCGRMLRERPVEAGLPPDFQELDERDDVAIRDAVWNLFIDGLYRDNDPLLVGITEVGIKPHDLTSFLRTRYEYADLELKPTFAEEPDLSDAVTRAGQLIQSTLPYLPTSWADEDDFTRMARRAELSISRDGLTTTLRQAEFLRAVDAGTSRPEKVTMSRWKDKAIAREFRNVRIPEFRRHLATALTAWREYAYTRVAPIADAAITYYETHRRRNGLVTFYDLLERSVVLLRDHPDVREHFQRRYRRLFVDEFQDTDPMQAQMLLLLSSTDPKQRDWTRVVPRPGSLFIVGDEKQSIYRFRRADIEVFRAVTDQVERHGGRVVNLTTSFRTLGNLCATLNGVFERIFQDDSADEHQAPFSPLSPERGAGRDATGVRRIDTSDRSKSAKTPDVEAEAIGNFIAAAIAGETSYNCPRDSARADEFVFDARAAPSDFLLVARERANLGAYARALEVRGIPYDISGGDALGKSEELGLLVDILSVIERPRDPVAYLKYLRGPLVGLSDQALYDYRKAGGRFDYRSPLPDDMASADEQVRGARSRIEFAEEALLSMPVFAAMVAIVDHFGIAAFGASLDGGTLRAGSMLRVLSYVRQWAAEGKGWTRVLDELRGLARDNVGTIETMTLEVGRPDVVRIMTVHQAKGLEAPVVILVDADRSSSSSWVEPHVARIGETPTLSMAVERSRQILAQPAGWEADSARELLFRNAEEDRIRYVGATRARNLALVCEHKGKGFWSKVSLKVATSPELEMYDSAGRPAPVGETADLVELQSVRRSRQAASAKPTMSYRTITGKDTEAAFVPVTGGGRGPAFGSAVHEILDVVVRQPSDPSHVDYVTGVLAKHLERPPDETLVHAVLDGLDLMKASPFWQRVLNATAVYTEVPVIVASHIEVLTGTIDLVLQSEAGWEIVDYKTDAAGGPDDLDALRSAYAPQVAAYCRFWNRTTGFTVDQAGLWHFGSGTYLPVEVPPAEGDAHQTAMSDDMVNLP